jgi:acetate---CoA ligase (ADP-forming)
VGASPKPDTVGNGMIRGLLGGGLKGRIYPINPNYAEIEGMRCYRSLAELPEQVEHALLGVANARLEAAMREAVSAGVSAATILASGYLQGDARPPLLDRLAQLARRGHAGLRRQRHGLLQQRGRRSPMRLSSA